MEFKPKEFLDKWVEENYPEKNISEEEFDNADMIMFAHKYHQAKLKLLGIALAVVESFDGCGICGENKPPKNGCSICRQESA